MTKETDGLCTLEIPSVEMSDGGVYSCAARDKYGEATTCCTLTVFGDRDPAPKAPIFLRPISGEIHFSHCISNIAQTE